MSEYTFDLWQGDSRAVITVEAEDYQAASAAVQDIRDQDFPGREITDHIGE